MACNFHKMIVRRMSNEDVEEDISVKESFKEKPPVSVSLGVIKE